MRSLFFNCISLVLFATTAGAFVIKEECLSRLNVLSGTKADLSVSFDWSEEVLREFNT